MRARREATRARCGSGQTVITLTRGAGYTAPGFDVSYGLTVCGDGTVKYEGSGRGVRAQGIQTARIDPQEVQKLVQAFLSANYFEMNDYRPRVTDAGGVSTSLVLGQQFKSVVDADVSPPNLRKLEDMVDKVAGSSRWVNIDAEGVHEKVREGWNVRSPEASLLLLKAAERGDAETVRAFIEEGADVNARVDYDARLWCRKPVTDPFRYVTVLQHATGVDVVKLLIAAGANVNPKIVIRQSPIEHQIDLGDSVSIKALLDAGAKLHPNP